MIDSALPPVTAYVALGANLGDRAGQIAAALDRLGRTPGVEIEAVSPLVETDAVADEAQPPYLNAVARLRTTLAPEALLEACLAVERMLGRVRPAGRRKAPRTIDLDLLLWGDAVVDEGARAGRPALVLPHPGLLARPFVRIPLAAVARPGLRHPVGGEALDRFAPHPGVRPWPGPSAP